MSATFSIMGKAFSQMRADADAVLNKAVWNMQSQSQESAEVVIKIKISATEGDAFIPEFEHTVSTVLKLKTEKKGASTVQTELEWDGAKNRYIVVSDEHGQMTFDDLREDLQNGPMPDLTDADEDAFVYGDVEYKVMDAEPVETELLPEGFRALPEGMASDDSEDETEAAVDA